MKTVKTAISIPVDILEAAKKKAEERDISFSAYVSNCIKSALSGCPIDEGETPVPPSLSADLEEIRERLTRLESIRVIPTVIPEVIPEEAPAPRAVTPDQAVLQIHNEPEITPAEVIPEVIPDVIPSSKRSGGKRKGAIPVTAEMREELINHFNELNQVGMFDSEIARTAGVGKTLVSLLRKSMDDKKRQKTIRPEEYEALKAVQQITS